MLTRLVPRSLAAAANDTSSALAAWRSASELAHSDTMRNRSRNRPSGSVGTSNCHGPSVRLFERAGEC
eukprot:2463391-Prymnesium_polylepis.2